MCREGVVCVKVYGIGKRESADSVENGAIAGNPLGFGVERSCI